MRGVELQDRLARARVREREADGELEARREGGVQSCGLFVAAMRMVEAFGSKPSRRRSSTESERRVASCMPPGASRLVASASISSMKMTLSPISAAASKTAAKLRSASPYHLETTDSSGRTRKGRPSSFARMRAVDVLPPPGGPSQY